MGCETDVHNACVHALPPKCKTYLRPNQAMKEFYSRQYNKTLKEYEVLQIMQMLQGRPEASAAWDAHMIEILNKYILRTQPMNLVSRAIINNKAILFARQVDDFRFAC